MDILEELFKTNKKRNKNQSHKSSNVLFHRPEGTSRNSEVSDWSCFQQEVELTMCPIANL